MNFIIEYVTEKIYQAR